MSDRFDVYAALPFLGFVPHGDGLKFVRDQWGLRAMKEITSTRIWFKGYYLGERVMGNIEFPLPNRVESLDQLKAFFGYYFRTATIKDPPPWLLNGLELSHLLPWE